MDKFFDSIWVLRLTALVLAALLFFYVNSSSDEKESTPSNTQVATIKDVPLEAYYDDKNLIVSGLPKTVDVTIEGPMPIVLETKITKDFKVFVDLSSLLIGNHRVAIQTEGLSDKLAVSVEPKYVNISIEEKVTKEFTVEPEINQKNINPQFVLQSLVAEPNTVKITGAKSVIERISYVKANVLNENSITESFTQKATVSVLDNNLNRLDVLINPETVNVKVVVAAYKKAVPIKLNRTGKEQNGVTINSLNLVEKNVEVFGQKSVVDNLKEIVVEFDVSKVDKSGNYKVNLKLPEGASKLSLEEITVVADVTVAEDTEGQPTEKENSDNQQEND